MTTAKKRPPAPLSLVHSEPADPVDQAAPADPRLAALVRDWQTLHEADRVALDFQRQAAAGRAAVDPPPALAKAAALIMDEIVSLPPYRGVPIERMSDLLFHAGIRRSKADGSPRAWSDREIRKEIIPKLELWGVVSTARIGYSLPASARNVHLMGQIAGRMATTSNS